MLKLTFKFVLYMLVSSFIIFFLVEHTAGNPAILYLQRHGYTQITTEHLEMAQHHLGLERNIVLRYMDWLGHALMGDLGHSFNTGEQVTTMIIQAVQPTLTLMIVAACILFALGYSIGYLIGIKPNASLSKVIRGIAQVLTSMPEYWLALLLIYWLGVHWHILPFVGSHSWQHFILPVIVIVFVDGAHIILMTSHLTSHTLNNDAYRLAVLRQVKFVDRMIIQVKEIFAPMITVTINTLIHLFGKIVILEVIFSMSGLGKLLITAMNQRDYPLIQGVIIFIIASIMLINYFGELMILKNDPRVARHHVSPYRKRAIK